jgi:2-methylcitrate dehydratase PrpD
MNANDPVGETLGRFVARSAWSDIGPSLRHEAKRSLLNFVGGALGVAQTPPIATIMRVLDALGGPARATVIGRAERLGILDAAFVNAISANLLDYDDTHLNTIIHPTAPVAPALLALAEERGLSGAAVLHAFILGVEVECRLGNAVSPGHYARGWHITATCGVFGAAAGSARLLGLTPAQTAHALGIAASQSCGLVENLPSGAKNVGVGNAARNGLLSALFAAQGVTAAPRAIEGPRGWALACGDQPDIAALTAGLGGSWELLKNTYKLYPCGIVLHSVIDACLPLRRDHAVSPEDIVAVTVLGDALLLARGDRAVANERDARVSIHHSAAVSLLFGAAGVREFSEEIVMRPEVAALRALVRPGLDAALPVGAATVVITTRDGRTLAATVTHARGSIEQRLSDRDIEDKVRALGGACADIDAVIDLIWRLDELPNLAPLSALLGPAA